MDTSNYLQNYETFVFELDDVLYPVKDFHLQVYYLFGAFIEYTEQIEALGIVQFMKATYEQDGHEGIFEKTISRFRLSEKYLENFNLLNRTAKLPLKLLMFEPVLQFMQDLVVERKEIYLLAAGDPEQQLNKIRQMEWKGMEQYIRVFFKSEITPNPNQDSVKKFIIAHKLKPEKVLFVAKHSIDQHMAEQEGIKFLSADKLFLS